jgi:hypothetical protein
MSASDLRWSVASDWFAFWPAISSSTLPVLGAQSPRGCHATGCLSPPQRNASFTAGVKRPASRARSMRSSDTPSPTVTSQVAEAIAAGFGRGFYQCTHYPRDGRTTDKAVGLSDLDHKQGIHRIHALRNIQGEARTVQN